MVNSCVHCTYAYPETAFHNEEATAGKATVQSLNRIF